MAPRGSNRIRPARPADIEVLVEHRRAMWAAIGGSSRSELKASDPPYRRWVRRMLREKRFRAWIAEDASHRPIGSGAVWLTEAQPRPGESQRFRPYILSMYTDPGHRGEGIASAIVRSAVRYAREHGYPRITLHAAEMGRSVYARLGFERSWEMRQRFDLPRPRRAARGRPRPHRR
jgi:GNAT superfamily N-acetyltransferase